MNIEEVKKQFELDIAETLKTGKFDDLFLKYFSKAHGITTKLLKELPKLTEAKKRELGPVLNKLQIDQKAKIEQGKIDYKKRKQNETSTDLTIPEKPAKSGMLHPTTQTIREMYEFFRYHGFSIAEGPEIETAEYNFRKLNLPEGHPATDLQDTLFLREPDLMLRTHTSSIESRLLTENKPPIRVVIPGRVYRNETPSKTNSSFFYQFQGVVVDEGISIRNLKYTLEMFHKFLFGDDIILRFRYKYYPEVSPGMGVDMKCRFCEGAGCDVCKQRGWVEVLGCGMIHCNTLKMCGIDPNVYTGFAWGMGLDRLVMQKFGISDIRNLYEGGMVYLQ